MRWLAIALVITTPAWAQQQPDEATKVKALQFGFIANGCSMVAPGTMIDVSKEEWVHDQKASPKSREEIERICKDLKESDTRTKGHQ